MVPHQHGNNLPFETPYQEQSNKQPTKGTPLELAFSHFVHAGEQLSFTNSYETRIVTSKDVNPVKALYADFTCPFEYIITYQKHTFPPDGYIAYSSPLHGAYTLRGPPSFIVA